MAHRRLRDCAVDLAGDLSRREPLISNINQKHQNWRAFPAIFGLKAAPVLGFGANLQA